MHPRRIRPFFRVASLIFFGACGAAGVSWGVAASPFVAGNVLAAWSLPAVTGWIGLIVLVACIARGRWFCRWACPVGLALQQTQKLAGARRPLMKVRLGRWLALASLGGAAFGLPLLLWLDPVVLFTAGLGVLSEPARIGAIAALTLLALIVVASALDRGFWCRCLCPAGGLQDVCAGVAFSSCRSEARRSASRLADAGRSSSRVPRRSFSDSAPASAGQRGGWCELHACVPRVRSTKRSSPVFARAAGIVVRACPEGIIHPVTDGDIDLLTPTVRFADTYCREDCARCTGVLPNRRA